MSGSPPRAATGSRYVESPAAPMAADDRFYMPEGGREGRLGIEVGRVEDESVGRLPKRCDFTTAVPPVACADVCQNAPIHTSSTPHDNLLMPSPGPSPGPGPPQDPPPPP